MTVRALFFEYQISSRLAIKHAVLTQVEPIDSAGFQITYLPWTSSKESGLIAYKANLKDLEIGLVLYFYLICKLL